MSNETNTLEEVPDTLDGLNAMIRDLQAKARVKEETEMLKESDEAKVEMPIADITLKLDKNGSDIDLKNVTPAEVLFLCAEHHGNAGGSPITRFTNVGRKITIDPVFLRAKLCEKYSKKKIHALFPGIDPKMPTSFSRAVRLGIEAELAGERLMDFHVQPLGTGAE
jgi:hypothetical protein